MNFFVSHRADRSAGDPLANRCARRSATRTRARGLFDASVDPTDARNDILGCFGRSDDPTDARGDILSPLPIRRTPAARAGPEPADRTLQWKARSHDPDSDSGQLRVFVAVV
jgi:hypothetical protein